MFTVWVVEKNADDGLRRRYQVKGNMVDQMESKSGGHVFFI